MEQPSPLKYITTKIQKDEEDDLSDIMKLTVHSKIDTKKKKKFVTSE